MKMDITTGSHCRHSNSPRGERSAKARRSTRAGGLIAAGLLCAALAPGAHAASISYMLNQSNVAGLPDGTDYLKVTVADGAAGAIDFTFEILGSLLALADPVLVPQHKFGIDSVGINLPASGPASAVLPANITSLPANWSVDTSKNQDGFGKFALIPFTNGAADRQSPTLSFSVTGISGDTPTDYLVLSSGTAGEGKQFFAAHVLGFASGSIAGLDSAGLPITSAYFGGSTPVPLPAPFVLLGTALTGVLAAARRRVSNPGV